jgi:hypothetical protein
MCGVHGTWDHHRLDEHERCARHWHWEALRAQQTVRRSETGDGHATADTYKAVVPFECPIASVEPGGKCCASTNAAISADHSVVAVSTAQLPHRAEHA